MVGHAIGLKVAGNSYAFPPKVLNVRLFVTTMHLEEPALTLAARLGAQTPAWKMAFHAVAGVLDGAVERHCGLSVDTCVEARVSRSVL